MEIIHTCHALTILYLHLVCVPGPIVSNGSYVSFYLCALCVSSVNEHFEATLEPQGWVANFISGGKSI